jgi:CRP-like cAMP-binding protein
MSAAPVGRVALGDVDPDLAAPAANRGADVRAPVFRFEPGLLTDLPSSRARTHLGFLIVKGVALRDVSVCGRLTAELFGPGDVIHLTDDDTESMLRAEVHWTVLEALFLAELDGSVLREFTRQPESVAAIVERALRRSKEGAIERSIASHVRVDVRVLAYLWHVADRFGKVIPGAVRVDLPLTHAVLARLIGARRPTVTTALQRLVALGYLKREGRSFVLIGDPSAVAELESRSPARDFALTPPAT